MHLLDVRQVGGREGRGGEGGEVCSYILFALHVHVHVLERVHVQEHEYCITLHNIACTCNYLHELVAVCPT